MNYERQPDETCRMIKTDWEIMFSFTEQVSDASCDAFKRHGFNFEPSRGVWLRTLKRKAVKSAKARA